jgi:hypothetical protein
MHWVSSHSIQTSWSLLIAYRKSKTIKVDIFVVEMVDFRNEKSIQFSFRNVKILETILISWNGMPTRTKKVPGLRKKSKKPYSGVPIGSGLNYRLVPPRNGKKVNSVFYFFRFFSLKFHGFLFWRRLADLFYAYCKWPNWGVSAQSVETNVSEPSISQHGRKRW